MAIIHVSTRAATAAKPRPALRRLLHGLHWQLVGSATGATFTQMENPMVDPLTTALVAAGMATETAFGAFLITNAATIAHLAVFATTPAGGPPMQRRIPGPA